MKNSFLVTLLIILISSGVFTFLLNYLYREKPELFAFIQKIPKGLRGKWFVRTIVLFLIMFTVSVLVVMAGLNDTLGSIIIGFFISLTDLIFIRSKIIDEEI